MIMTKYNKLNFKFVKLCLYFTVGATRLRNILFKNALIIFLKFSFNPTYRIPVISINLKVKINFGITNVLYL